MKNTEMFKALNGVDEKYIKEADLLLNAPEKRAGKTATVLRVLFPAAAAIALLSVVLTITLALRLPADPHTEQTPAPHGDNAGTATDAEKDDLTYVKYSDHVEITAFTADDTKVEIPAKIDGLPVTSAALKKARHSETTEHIDVHTNSVEFTTLTLPEGSTCTLYAGPDVEYLEPSLLRNKQIVRVEVDELNDVYTAVDGILYSRDLQNLVACPAGTSLESIGTDAGKCDSVFPAELEVISARAFENCTSLVSVTLPGKVLIIDRRAFYGCASLERITIPKPIECASDALSGCSVLKTLYTELDAKSFEKLSINLPDGVTLVTEAKKRTGK